MGGAHRRKIAEAHGIRIGRLLQSGASASVVRDKAELFVRKTLGGGAR